MEALDELEATLRARWDRETLAVYGDHLMSRGDLRGELVALDLRIDDEGATPELLARKEELIASWVGDSRLPGAIRYGFFDVDATSAQPDEQLAAAFRAPPARFVRSVSMVGDQQTVAAAIAMVAAQPRPWLQHLSIRPWPLVNQQHQVVEQPRIAGRALVEATPNLATLEVAGRRVIGIAHPNIHTLVVSGYEAISIDGTFTALTSLDFAFQAHLAPHPEPTLGQLAGQLPGARLPALHTLDLSRNEPGAHDPDHLGGKVDIVEFLGKLAIRDRVVTLRLPSISDAQRGRLQKTLLEMHALRDVWIRAGRDLKHPTATIRFG